MLCLSRRLKLQNTKLCANSLSAAIPMLDNSFALAIERDHVTSQAAQMGFTRIKLTAECASATEGVTADDIRFIRSPSLPLVAMKFHFADSLVKCATFENRTGFQVQYSNRGVAFEPPLEVGLALYRIVQEGLRNCQIHSDAGRASVTLNGDQSTLVLVIEDPGVGFDTAMTFENPGLGLSSIEERARLIGAQLVVDSAPGRGTRIEVTVPVRP